MIQKKVSVIIPSFNSGQTIERAFRAINVQTLKNLISEIIVVDSSSDNNTKEILSRYKSEEIKVIDAGIKVMPAISRNIGASHAKGELLLFLDADTYPASDWLEKILEAYEKGYMVGGGGIALPDFQENSFLARAQYYLQSNEYLPCGKDKIKKFVPACNMFCDRELFNSLGGFPEIRAAEDVLFGLNASKRAQLLFVPEAKVYHIFNENWQRFIKNQKLLGRYIYLYRKQYYNNFMYKGVISIVLFPVIFCIKLLRIMLRIFQAGWHHIYHFIITIPIFLVGLLSWSIGFIGGCLSEGNSKIDA